MYGSPRAITAAISQINAVDLTRRSPSYENRLSKYSRRGFEVYWPQLDRSRVDPTIFERNFARTQGLARLLVLEKLPKSSEREAYMNQRRSERGRPTIDSYHRNQYKLRGNIKAEYEDETAEWVEEDEVSNYHTFTIPYGEKFHAKKIEKLLYTKDLLLNAEWNKPKEREVNLHRHPAFFGRVEDVIQDCCLFCPKPVTEEDIKVAEEESKIYVSGVITFIKDDPGRQAIGSFNPITDQDWTEMAYVGNTARLCQAIVEHDYEHVQDWLAGEDADVNRRDYTGRTPLQLAILSSTPEIVKLLVDSGARMISRLADGRTAIHLAAQAGNVEMIKVLMDKSEENEAVEMEKEDRRKEAASATKDEPSEEKKVVIADRTAATESKTDESTNEDADEDIDMLEDEDDGSFDEDHDMQSATTGSFIKVDKKEADEEHENLPEDNVEDPDIIDINVLSWDLPCTPLHFAIMYGHIDAVKALVQDHGADVLLPVKFTKGQYDSSQHALMTLTLALTLPRGKSEEMAKTLLDLGASCAQADMDHHTVFQSYAAETLELINVLFKNDMASVNRVLNHLVTGNQRYYKSVNNPLIEAIRNNKPDIALRLLEAGSKNSITFGDWVKAYETQHSDWLSAESSSNEDSFKKQVEQPVTLALKWCLPEIALKLLEDGADVNTLTTEAQEEVSSMERGWSYGHNNPCTVLDLVRLKLTELQEYEGETEYSIKSGPPLPLKEDSFYMSPYQDEIVDETFKTYKAWTAKTQLDGAKSEYEMEKERYEKRVKELNEVDGAAEKKEKIKELIAQLEKVEAFALEKGAKTLKELYPKWTGTERTSYNRQPAARKEFEVNFSFRVGDLTDERKEGYIKL